jgi:TonB family protein
MSLDMPDYPVLARLSRIEGRVCVKIDIGKDGSITSAQVCGGHPLLREAALKAVRTWKFRSALSGEPPTSQQTVTFEFKIQGEEIEKNPCPRVTFEGWNRVEIVTRPAPLQTMESH